MAIQRQGGQPQARGPAPHPLGNEIDRPGGKPEAVLGHQLVCFGDGEGQVGRADLGQLPG